MRKVTIMGNIGKDAEIKQTEKSNFIVFSVATQRFKNDQVLWVTCKKNQSTELAKYLTKGTKILVQGNLNVREYESNGFKHFEVECQVDFIEFCGQSQSAPQATQAPQPVQAPTPKPRVNEDLFGGQAPTDLIF